MVTKAPPAPEKKIAPADIALAFNVSAGALAAVMKRLVRIVPTKTSLPVIESVLIADASAKSIKITATNLEIEISATIPATIDHVGSCLLDARRLTDWLSSQPTDETFSLAVGTDKNRKVKMQCGSASLDLTSQAVEDFPLTTATPKYPDSRTVLSLSGKLFAQAVDQIIFAAAPDDTRPLLGGVLIRITDSILTLAAADGFRLGVRTVEHGAEDFAMGDSVSVIVPRKALAELTRLLDKDEDEDADLESALQIQWWTSNGKLDVAAFAYGPYLVRTRLIEGQYPAYERIIPADPTLILRLSTAKLKRAVRGAIAMARSDANIIRLTVGVSPKNALEVRGLDNALGQAADTIRYEHDGEVGGTGMEVAFNGRYLLDLLNVMPDELHLQLTSGFSPGTFRPVSSDDLIHVIMPMHVVRP